ncbi:MAG: hypothetical protein QOH01_3125 [Verrucomicrobiota bacterium]|jgi:hypothetical protein
MAKRHAPEAAKPKINEILRERLTRQEGNLRRAADRLQLNYQRLRQDLSENNFSAADLRILCDAVGLPTDPVKLRGQYEFKSRAGVRGTRKIHERRRAMLAGPLKRDGSGLPATFDYYEARQEQIARVVDSAGENIQGLFHGLGKPDSLFLTVIDEEPIHWQEEQAATALPRVAEAIMNGAMIAYLHPSDELYDELKRYGFPALEPGFLRARFKDFIDVLTLHLPKKERSRVEEQVTRIGFRWPTICVPYFRFALYHHNPGEHSRVWATVTVPMMNRARSTERQTNRVILELDKTATSFLHGLCRRAVTSALKQPTDEEVSRTAVAELFRRLCPGAKE